MTGTPHRLFLDANVLFSAAWAEGPCRILIELGQAGEAEVLTSVHAWAETRRNLARKRPDRLPFLKAAIAPVVAVVQCGPSGSALPAHLPDKDRVVLDAAVALRCTHFITGDRAHFGALVGTAVEGVLVLTPRQYLGLRASAM